MFPNHPQEGHVAILVHSLADESCYTREKKRHLLFHLSCSTPLKLWPHESALLLDDHAQFLMVTSITGLTYLTSALQRVGPNDHMGVRRAVGSIITSSVTISGKKIDIHSRSLHTRHNGTPLGKFPTKPVTVSLVIRYWYFRSLL